MDSFKDLTDDMRVFINGLTHAVMLECVNYTLANLDTINFGFGNIVVKSSIRFVLKKVQKKLTEFKPSLNISFTSLPVEDKGNGVG